jgi:hypothetical protein
MKGVFLMENDIHTSPKDESATCCYIGSDDRDGERRTVKREGHTKISIVGWICRRILGRRKLNCIEK